MKKAKDIVAKLMAEEDIEIVRAPVSTASFDLVSRVLTIPNWKDLSDVVEDMFIGHEIGHAKHTNITYIDKLKTENNNPLIMDILNVLEDNRIERLVKEEYPNMRQTFSQGYKELWDKGFFGEISDAFIDKVNIYSKVGVLSGVEFDSEEQELFDKINTTVTMADVISLVDEVKEFTKKNLGSDVNSILDNILNEAEKKHINKKIKETSTKSESSRSDEDSVSINDSEKFPTVKQNPFNESSWGSSDDDAIDKEDRISFNDFYTDDDVDAIIAGHLSHNRFLHNLDKMVDKNTQFLYYTTDDYVNLYGEGEIHYTEILKNCKNAIKKITTTDYKNTNFNNLMSVINGNVSGMIREFEMRKAADEQKRLATHRTGELNMRKIHNYKISDNLFKTYTTVKSGKNHGMIMLVDWSMSMQDIISDTLIQVVHLAVFCRKMNIPYRVFAFTSKNQDIERNKTDKKQIMLKVNHFEFFNERMSAVEFNDMCKLLLNYVDFVSVSQNYRLDSTPLNDSLLIMNDYIKEFKKSSNVEKTSFVVLTDGESSAIGGGFFRNKDTDEDQLNLIINKLTDTVTKSTYTITESANDQRNKLLEMIKDRNDTNNIVFYLAEKSFSYKHSSAVSSSFNTDIIKSNMEEGYTFSTSNAIDKLFYVDVDMVIKHINDDNTYFSYNMDMDIVEDFKDKMKSVKLTRFIMAEVISTIS